MNREERRSYMKQGVSKETVDKMARFTSPCSVAEAAQISRAAAEDVLEDYQRHMAPLQMALSMQLEILKGMLIEEGVISEEKFRELYMRQAEEVNSVLNQSSPIEDQTPKMEIKADDIEVKVER